MLKFSKLIPERVYRIRNMYTVPYSDKNRTRGYMMAVFGENMSDTPEFFENKFWSFKLYKRYFVDRKINDKIAGKTTIERLNQNDVYDEYILPMFPELVPVRMVQQVKDFNCLYELNKYSELIEESKRIKSKSQRVRKDMKIDEYVRRLEYVSQLFPNHKKYLMIPVHKYIDNPKSPTIWTKRSLLDNHLIQLLRVIQEKPMMFKKLKDWTFVFNNVNEVFYIECKDIGNSTGELLRGNFHKFRSRVGAVVFDDCADDGLSVDENEAEEEISLRNNENLEDVIDNKIEVISNLPISHKRKEDLLNRTIKSAASIIDNHSSDDVSTLGTDMSAMDSSVKRDFVKTTVKPSYAQQSRLGNNKISRTSTNTILKSEADRRTESIRDARNYKDATTIVKTSSNKLVTKEQISDDADKLIKKELAKDIKPTNKASIQRQARMNKIQKEMTKLKVDDKTIEEISMEAKMKKIDEHVIKADVINPNMKEMKFDNFEKGYNDKLFDYDLTNILMSFAEKDRPLILISLEKEDTSDTLDQRYTYRAIFEDERGKRHTLKFNMPKFSDNKFMHMGGSDKLFINQILPLPVTKTAPDTVQVSSNYNKLFITRFGKSVSSKITKFHKYIPDVPKNILKYTTGNYITNNSSALTTMEYDELSSKYGTIELVHENIVIYFNQEEINHLCETYELGNYSSDSDDHFDVDKFIPFALDYSIADSPKLILLNSEEDVVDGTELSTIDYIINSLSKYDENLRSEFLNTTSGKKFVYTRARIMARDVPVVLLLSFLNGLEPLLNKLDVDYTFYDESNPRLSSEDKINKGVCKFKDGTLIYDNNVFANALLLNGLSAIPTDEFDFLAFNSKDIYYDIFLEMFGRRNIGVAFENFEQLFIDPITKEVLEDYNLPTNFTDLIIYANSLLENNTYDLDGDMKNCRIRTNEMANAHLYKILSTAYEKYRASADNKNPTKFSIKENSVINNMMESQVVEEYSVLNPLYEIDRMRATSYKGIGGCNEDRAFKMEKRGYNHSMMGVFAQSSPISSNVGVSRILSANPNITSLRGYIEPGSKDDIDRDNINCSSMLAGSELLVPFGATHDDPSRVAMSATQSHHTLATEDSDQPLFGYGYDKIVGKSISNKFAYKAKDDGYIKEVNDELHYIMVEYKNGKNDIIDISNKEELNTGSGFYIDNKLSPIFEAGHKFKKDDILAINNSFFRYDEFTGDVVYTTGPLARIALIFSNGVYEDSTMVTERLSDRLSSRITEKKEVKIGKNSNVYSMVHIGQEVRVGDPLIVFDESFDDEMINSMVKNMNDDDRRSIIDAGKQPVKCKYNGTIIDIKIYYTVPKSELSDSLQKVISNYEKPIKERNKIYEENGINHKDLVTLNELPTYTEAVGNPPKIKGVTMGDSHVLIEFYVQVIDKFAPGDKLTFSTALKGTNQRIIAVGEEPYLASDPNEKIDAFCATAGYYARMTDSFPVSLALNNVLLGAEKKIKDILKS